MSCKVAGVDVADVRIGKSDGTYTGISKAVLGKSDGTGMVVWEKGGEEEPTYLRFTFAAKGTKLTLTQYGAMQSETSTSYTWTSRVLKYSTNGGSTWTTWGESAASGDHKTRTFTSTAAGQQLLVMGTGTALSPERKYLSSGDEYYYSGEFIFSATGNVAASGNVRSLINFAETIPERCFTSLFSGMGQYLTSAPSVLDATTIGYRAYYSMFKGCTALTSIPALRATTLDGYSYGNMFYGCTGLTDVRNKIASPTTVGGVYAFARMFYNCTGLVHGANFTIPSTATLGNYAFRDMYFGCTALTDVTFPCLSRATIPLGCCAYMFSGCTSLVNANWNFSCTEAENSAFRQMFSGCTSLETAPTFNSITEAGSSAFREMFYECTALESFGELKATVIGTYTYSKMFCGCTSLASVGKIHATRAYAYSCSYMFYGCIDLGYEADFSLEVMASTIATGWANYMFSGCESLRNLKVHFSKFSGTTSWLGDNAGSCIINPTLHCNTALATVIAGLSSRTDSNLPSDWSYVADMT